LAPEPAWERDRQSPNPPLPSEPANRPTAPDALKFSCTARPVTEPLTPNLGSNALMADDEMAAFLELKAGVICTR